MMYHLLLLKKIKSKDMEIFLLFCIICVKNKILVFLILVFLYLKQNSIIQEIENSGPCWGNEWQVLDRLVIF